MNRNKSIAMIAGVAVLTVAGFIILQISQPKPMSRAFEIPSGSSACVAGKITVYAYNNGHEAMNSTAIKEAQITGPRGAYIPPMEATDIEPSHSEAIIAAYGCGDAASKCPPGSYTIRLGAAENAAIDRVRCG